MAASTEELLALLAAQDEPTAMDRQKAFAQALRGQSGVGQLALLTGDPVLGGYGKTLLGDAAAQRDLAATGIQGRMQRGNQQTLQGQELTARAKEGGLERANRLKIATMGNEGDMLRALLAQRGQKEQQARQSETEMRKELMGNPVTRATQDVATAYERVKAASAAPSAAGDIALVYGFMKLMDPGSTVREGEFATAQNAGSVPQSILAQYNKIVSGERLAPELRKDFLGQAQRLYQAQLKRYGALEKSYRGLAEGAGADPSRVAIPLGLETSDAPSPTAGPSPEDAAALEWAKANPNDPRAAQILKMTGGGQ